MIIPVVMAGGSGTRLWPLSRGNYPKQFLALNSQHTMLQETLLRLDGLPCDPAMLICNEEHRFIAAEQVRQLNKPHNGIFLEPVGRNTAPAIALAAFNAVMQAAEDNQPNKEPLLLVLAADHVIEDTEAFQAAVLQAQTHAQQDSLVTFGIVPQSPETGYGYIKRGQAIDNAFSVSQFVEKPVLSVAEQYLASGDYYWNSGMFMFKARRYLEELKHYRPDIYEACEKAMQVRHQDMDFIRIDADAFAACPDESIDYAVMEPLSQQDSDKGNQTAEQAVVVVPLDAGWNDVGGFSALWQVSPQDEHGNAIQGDVKTLETSNTLINAGDKLVAAVGVENLVIINTKDAVLVAHKDKAQAVKTIVNELKSESRPEATFHREVYRPWGKYDSVDCGERFQVKRITVKPGAKLSVQMHHHRAEHWIVVSGTAKVTNGDKEILLTENQSTYIPIGVVHALENPGKLPLELIEIQSGSYLGEDDIVRFEDRYGRA
ncbi:mannose-1-phosphate guanylyltransferase/mannose-6-phosphate isomerase [Flocculibacter collagenilyticus]|uniref:mannose-1-phosphate guanylyltransferase/mannose-6-phosphate isomerase n=1 Tax=Flocculibacter collagenilyticus TaxID=2744479 RepID=UPI0018F39734|nr:mannose-1-phosphate guanylyltransferase/mannose-6-phosphate isomerase [Flocculibacter collagenilyticus]